MEDNKQKSIDERLEWLVQSSESLHASVQELHAAIAEERLLAAEDRAQMAHQERRLNQLHRAMLLSIQTYLRELDGAE